MRCAVRDETVAGPRRISHRGSSVTDDAEIYRLIDLAVEADRRIAGLLAGTKDPIGS